VALLVTSFIQFNQNQKENIIRKLHGNSDLIVSKRIVLPFILISLIAYFLMITLMFFVKAGSINSLSLLFAKELGIYSLIFVMLLFSVILLVQLTIYLKGKVTALKQSFISFIPFFITSIIKTLAVFMITTPLILSFRDYTDRKSNLKLVNKDTEFLSSLAISQPAQPYDIHMDMEKYVEWEASANTSLINILKEYQIYYSDVYHYYFNKDMNPLIIPYAIISHHYVNTFEMTDKGNLLELEYDQNF